ncbi:MAG: hypothetical protein WDN50_18265 [Bradyrhizobium sp.]
MGGARRARRKRAHGTDPHPAVRAIARQWQCPVVNLPIYVEIASGTATLGTITCGHPNVSTSDVRLGVTPGIVDAWIGNVTVADLTNFTTNPIRRPRPWSIWAP